MGRIYHHWPLLYHTTQSNISAGTSCQQPTLPLFWGCTIIKITWELVLDAWYLQNEQIQSTTAEFAPITGLPLLNKLERLNNSMTPVQLCHYKTLDVSALHTIPMANVQMLEQHLLMVKESVSVLLLLGWILLRLIYSSCPLVRLIVDFIYISGVSIYIISYNLHLYYKSDNSRILVDLLK
jgi:hypothetical protein